MTAWTQIKDTDMAKAAWDIINTAKDRGLAYHNADHINAMYQYLHDTDETYNVLLDWAVLYHDIIYDAKPEKETRSIVQFLRDNEKYGELEEDLAYEVVNFIATTSHHRLYEPSYSAIIRADLHHLAKHETTLTSYVDVLRESKALYGIDAATFAKRNREYMISLASRVYDNIADDDSRYAEFYSNVLVGISRVITLSGELL